MVDIPEQPTVILPVPPKYNDWTGALKERVNPQTGQLYENEETKPMQALGHEAVKDLVDTLNDIGATQPMETVHLPASKRPPLNWHGQKVNLPS